MAAGARCRLFLSAALVVGLPAAALAQAGAATAQAAAPAAAYRTPLTPLVIVVHGIGGGNREDGWSAEGGIPAAWGVDPADIREINFTYEGRGQVASYGDFGEMAQPWAEHVQQELVRHLSNPANAGRPVIVVSHSWGTVMTKVALEGGHTKSGSLSPLDDALPAAAKSHGPPVDHLFTLGSPLGRDGKALDLRQVGVTVERGKPEAVKQWTNVFAPDDPVSSESWNLDGADENLRLDRSWYQRLPLLSGPLGLLSHMFIWTNDEVVRRVHNAYTTLQEPQTLAVHVTSTSAWSVVGSATVTAEGPVTRTAGPAAALFLHDLPNGRYRLTVSAHGYKSRSTDVLVTARSANSVTVQLEPGDEATPDAVYVQCTVIDRANGKPVSGATVTLSGAITRSARTSADGRATLDDLAPGTYAFTAVADGYRRAQRDGFKVGSSLRGTIRLTAEEAAATPREPPHATTSSGPEISLTLGAAVPESFGPALPPVPVGIFTAPGPGTLHITFTLRAAPRPELQYATGYGQGYRAEAKLMWEGVVTKDSLAAGELRGRRETTKMLPITVREAGDVIFSAAGEWTIARQVDGKWVDGPGGDRRHYLPGQVTVELRFVPAK